MENRKGLARQKRPRSDDESEPDLQSSSVTGVIPVSGTQPQCEETIKRSKTSHAFAKFIIIEAVDKEKPITKLSPFVIEKQLSSILGTPKSVKSLKNQTLLVECNTKNQAENLLGTKSFFNNKVRVYPHPTLNSSRGVIRCKELSVCSLEVIKEELADQGVTDVKRISIKRNGEVIQTNTYLLTFDRPVLPAQVNVGYLVVDVSVYIPNPLRCFKCQKYGHHGDACRAHEPVCGRCAEKGHSHTDCTGEVKCANCGEKHQVISRQCAQLKKEKAIIKIKYTENVSFLEARAIYDQRQTVIEASTSATSYANVSKPQQQNITQPQANQLDLLIEKLCELLPEKATLIRKVVEPSQKKPSEKEQKRDDSSSQTSSTSKTSQVTSSKTATPSTSTKSKSPTKPSKEKKQTQSVKQNNVVIQDYLKPNPNHEQKSKQTNQTDKPEKKTKKKNKKELTEEEIKECDEKAKEYFARRKLTRYEVPTDKDSVDVAVGSIPVCRNMYGALESEDMDAEENPQQSLPFDWGEKDPDSWEDDQGTEDSDV